MGRKSGVFFVNQRKVPAYPDGTKTVDQMCVSYDLLSEVASGRVPIVLLPGGFHTSVCYDETPDGRPGWKSYLPERGFSVYLPEPVGHGRSGFDHALIDKAHYENKAELLPPILSFSQEVAWGVFRFGPSYPDFHPGTQFPQDAIDHYWAQLVPNAEVFQADPNGVTVDALGLLLKRIGPAVLVGHSQSGRHVVPAAMRYPDLVRGVINLEPACGAYGDPASPPPLSLPDIAYEDGLDDLAKVPFLFVWGDNLAEAPFWESQIAWVEEFSTNVTKAGGDVSQLSLPEVGEPGNTHLMMLELNNLAIADLLVHWIESHVECTR
ncbi:alpha/beta fold hydrolase [Sciscionella marina]|uniref:alpha/beta fold hydrolase n=1 Tax=Sciscionella marina TaxID=508770 RepID=UPI0012F6AE52|nr:alpha/beta fold hydrolase [Sciscionella marina]